MGNDRIIDQYASRQHGAFNYSQAIDAGFDKYAIRRRVKSGVWFQLDHTVFCLPSAPGTWHRQVTAAWLSRRQALVGGASAAYLHRLRGFRPTRPVIVVPGSANTRSKLARVIRCEHFDELAWTRFGSLPVTNVSETILCLAPSLRLPRLAEVFDDALLTGKLHLNEIAALTVRESGRRRSGIVSIRYLIEDRSPNAPGVGSSYLEGMLEMLLNSMEIPQWTREHPFSLEEQQCRVDVYVPAWNLVIEADGRTWHMLKEDFESDRRRDNALASRGIQVLRFTYRMLASDPDGCINAILETGHVRSA